MFFGLAILAGLFGFAFVDPMGIGDDSENLDEVNDQTQQPVSDGSELLGDVASDDADVATEDPEPADDTPAVVTDTPAIPDDVIEEAGIVIDGTDSDDLIYGGDGDYIMNGGDGDDQLHGGDGNTTINGDEGNDTLYAGDGFVGASTNTLSGGAGDDTLFGSNEAENTLDGGDGNDAIHLRGQDTATGGAGTDAFHYATEYSNGMQSMITDYDVTEDQIIVEHAAGFISGGEIPAPEVTITIEGNDAVICLDGDECIVVQGAANSLTVEDILLRANPVI